MHLNINYYTMKKLSAKLIMLAISVLIFSFSRAADNDQWPKQVRGKNGTIIKVYEPAPESFEGNTLKFRSAISITQGNADPVFGTFWASSKVETDRDNRQIVFNTLNITDLKIPSISDQNTLDEIDNSLETQFPTQPVRYL